MVNKIGEDQNQDINNLLDNIKDVKILRGIQADINFHQFKGVQNAVEGPSNKIVHEDMNIEINGKTFNLNEKQQDNALKAIKDRVNDIGAPKRAAAEAKAQKNEKASTKMIDGMKKIRNVRDGDNGINPMLGQGTALHKANYKFTDKIKGLGSVIKGAANILKANGLKQGASIITQNIRDVKALQPGKVKQGRKI